MPFVSLYCFLGILNAGNASYEYVIFIKKERFLNIFSAIDVSLDTL